MRMMRQSLRTVPRPRMLVPRGMVLKSATLEPSGRRRVLGETRRAAKIKEQHWMTMKET
jgi:hypothetical protein